MSAAQLLTNIPERRHWLCEGLGEIMQSMKHSGEHAFLLAFTCTFERLVLRLFPIAARQKLGVPVLFIQRDETIEGCHPKSPHEIGVVLFPQCFHTTRPNHKNASVSGSSALFFLQFLRLSEVANRLVVFRKQWVGGSHSVGELTARAFS